MTRVAEHDVVIVGAGFSGIAMARALLREGRRDVVVLEREDDVGGTWRDNAYPGCACDVPSHLYSLSFARNPGWSSTYSGQEEIHRYLRDASSKHGVNAVVRFRTEVEAAEWDADAGRWHLRTSRGPLAARVLILATGPFSAPKIPPLPGLDTFAGTLFHSARWDHDHALEGRRVAVVGTGASAIQFVPEIQPVVERLTVFQRTPPWVMPRRARAITGLERFAYRRVPGAQRAMRRAIGIARELYALPLMRARLAPLARRAALRHLRRQVRDPELRRAVTPDYAPGCKRILLSNDYYPALSADNVDVVCGAVREVRPHGIVGGDGVERPVDTIIFGTGFEVTDVPVAERVVGVDGRTLAARWDGSPQAHRGTTISGFPNLFFLLGPNTGLGHTSVILMAEAQVRYVRQALAYLERARTGGALEVREDAQERWNAEVQRRMEGTVWTDGGCASWYLDREGRNTTLWPSFARSYTRAVRRFDPDEYRLEVIL